MDFQSSRSVIEYLHKELYGLNTDLISLSQSIIDAMGVDAEPLQMPDILQALHTPEQCAVWDRLCFSCKEALCSLVPPADADKHEFFLGVSISCLLSDSIRRGQDLEWSGVFDIIMLFAVRSRGVSHSEFRVDWIRYLLSS